MSKTSTLTCRRRPAGITAGKTVPPWLNGGVDIYRLYQLSVQDPPREIRFIRRTFRNLRGRDPFRLREDFCGTAYLACEWVRRIPGGVAAAVDLDPVPLEYAREKLLPALGRKASRLSLIQDDVLRARTFRADVITAYNFSYFIFKERKRLAQYFSTARRNLVSDGILFLDIYGGPQAQQILEESTEHDGFTYVWEQATYNPITGEMQCYIHFDLPGGKRIRRAFSYNWRLWGLPEIRDLLREVGFREVLVYWEGTDTETGGGNGVFRLTTRGDDSLSWIAYVVAVK